MPKKIDPALRERAVRLVREHRSEYSSTTAAAVAVARQLGVARESVRRWVAQAEIDDGARPGTTSEESAEIKRLKAENRRLREDNEILKAATVFFASMPLVRCQAADAVPALPPRLRTPASTRPLCVHGQPDWASP
jgi:transposase-like protein